MGFPRVLVSGVDAEGHGLLLHLDPGAGTYRVVLPYRMGGVHVGEDMVAVAHVDSAVMRTRLEVFDRGGLAWSRPIPYSVDTHSLTRVGDRFAACSTGTNEVIFLDGRGEVVQRWGPDERAESDSWHLNSLVSWDGRLAVTCFGRFDSYRGWGGRTAGSGLLIEVPSGNVLARGLTFPHDPTRVEDGWIINDSVGSRVLFYPDGASEPRPLCQVPLFPRGLVATPSWLVVGLSVRRHAEANGATAAVAVIDRRTNAIVKTVPLPLREIGHIVLPPAPDLLAAMTAAGPLVPLLEEPARGPCPAAWRRGHITALEALQALPGRAGYFHLRVRLANEGPGVWSSRDDYPVRLGYEILDAAGAVLDRDPSPQLLPMPVLPGRTLTLPLTLDLRTTAWHLAAASVRLTLVGSGGDCWAAADSWEPCRVPLAPWAGLPEAAAVIRNYEARTEALQAELGWLAGVLELTRADSDKLRAHWEAVADLGPTTVKLARQMGKLARRLPVVSRAVKRALAWRER